VSRESKQALANATWPAVGAKEYDVKVLAEKKRRGSSYLRVEVRGVIN
jgi:hypothetical protein